VGPLYLNEISKATGATRWVAPLFGGPCPPYIFLMGLGVGVWGRGLVPFAPSTGQNCLVSGFCPSGHGFAPRFLQTPPPDDALARSSTLHLHQVG
jgi:hypothetical protein